MRSAVLGVMVSLLLSACCLFGADRREQLEGVAKDWCETIRASQVIPIYPLTEDLRPGDVFLVTRAVDDDRDLFEERGFLPLDLNIARLDMSAQLKSTSAFQHPMGMFLDGPIWPPSTMALANMSRVGFPTYSVEVDRQLGLQLAIPVQSVPISLSAMRADHGTASVSLQEAYTYGLDASRIQAALDAWMNRSDTLNLLATASGSLSAGSQRWIRVVSRVYLVKNVTVDVATDESAGANLGVGVSAPDAQLVDLEADVQARVLEAIQSSPSVLSAPAGRLQVVSVGRRSVTMKEEFPRPLVVGYLAYQARLNADGTLGSGLASTLEIVANGLELPAYGTDANTEIIRTWLKGGGGRPARLREFVDQTVPSKPSLTVVLRAGNHAGDRIRIVDELVNAPE